MSSSIQIVADIGGSNARFAHVKKGSDELLGVKIFSSADFPFFIDTIRSYMKAVNLIGAESICLAVAATVTTDHIDFPNNQWSFSRAELQASLGIPITLINDFDAQALALDGLHDCELRWIGLPRPAGELPKAVLGPGTGLGVSAILPGGCIVPSEGGHIAFAPLDDHEIYLQKALRSRYGRVSIERILSGAGLSDLYWANSRLDGCDTELTAAEVTAAAIAGDLKCVATVTDFLSILASVAGDVALMMGATGGVYVAGGIVPRLLSIFDEKLFRKRFDDKGRYSHMCAAVPLAIVIAEYSGLRGCVTALRKTSV